MATSTLPQTLLNYINNGTYPDSEEIASATLSSTDLSTLLSELRKAQNEAKDSIRSLSRSTAPNIDAWISRARNLQTDILRSRDEARQIVQAAEAGEKLKAEVADKGGKVALLEREVEFNETLEGTLEHVRYARSLLERAREEAVRGDVGRALRRLEDAEASIAGLTGGETGGTGLSSRAAEVLQQRAGQLREELVESATECWNALVMVDAEGGRVTIQRDGLKTALPEAAVPEISLDAIVTAVKGLDVFDSLLQKLARDIDRAILKQRMIPDENEQVTKLSVSGSELKLSTKTSDPSPDALFEDLYTLLSYLSTNLPPAVTQPLSNSLIPALTSRLETHWLDPAIPLSIDEMPSFQHLLQLVTGLAQQIDGFGWSGAEGLREWVNSAPRLWLTKRREALLGEVRDWVFRGLRERRTVERVETRMVRREDVGLARGEDGDDWDAWDEDDQSKPEKAEKGQVSDELDEAAMAWELDEDETSEEKDRSSTDGAEEDDAWGWGDEEPSSQKASSPVASKKQIPNPSAPPNGEETVPNEQELTLRETFTTTAIPSAILAILQKSIADAQTLSGPTFAEFPLAPAASALYTLPTLALAIYRATAPTAYAKDKDGLGGMLIYNDASWLAEQLRAWKESEATGTGSKLRVDADVTALETFARKAYSAEMEAQRIVLRDLLDGAQGFGSCTQQPFKREAEGAVEAVVDRVRTVGGMWEGVLSKGALLQSLGSLVGTVTGKMITDVLDLGDISEVESQTLKALCDKVTALKDLFTQPAQDSSSAAGGSDMTFIYCPSWLKFQYLAEILESSLADIRWMWREGELSLEFGAEEVVGLVEALFAESPLRREAVREIRQGGRGG